MNKTPSGSGAVSPETYSFYSKLSFPDDLIKREDWVKVIMQINCVNVGDMFSGYIIMTDLWNFFFPTESNHLFRQC